jgi:hypothetical protein
MKSGRSQRGNAKEGISGRLILHIRVLASSESLAGDFTMIELKI